MKTKIIFLICLSAKSSVDRFQHGSAIKEIQGKTKRYVNESDYNVYELNSDKVASNEDYLNFITEGHANLPTLDLSVLENKKNICYLVAFACLINIKLMNRPVYFETYFNFIFAHADQNTKTKLRAYCLEIYLSGVSDLNIIDRFISDNFNEAPLIFPNSKFKNTNGKIEGFVPSTERINYNNTFFILTCLVRAEGKLNYNQYVDKERKNYTEELFQTFLDSDQFKKIEKSANGEYTDKKSWINEPMFNLNCIETLKKVFTRNYK